MVGCTIGEGGEGGDAPDRIPHPDPLENDRLDQLGIVCESTLMVSGTFQETMPPPAGDDDCWEVGIWTVNMIAVDFQGCDPQPALDMTFVYEVLYDDDSESTFVRFSDDPDNERMNLKITTDSSGQCQGIFEHFGTSEFRTTS